MKEKLKNKKVLYTLFGIIAICLVAILLTYAYWYVTKSQKWDNVIMAACLDISLSNEENDITLLDQFPLSDEDGMELVPYTFTVTNNCSTSLGYQITLEALGEESTSISSNALKVALNDNAGLFSSYAEVDTTVEGAYEARQIGYGSLASKDTEGSSATHSLRIWIDEDASVEENDKMFRSKISVTAGKGIGHNELHPTEKAGTLAYSILSNYGGINEIQTINTDWIEGEYESETYQSMKKDFNYYWGTEMFFDEETGKYKLGGTIVEATVTECRNGQKSDGTEITCSYTLGYLNSYAISDYSASYETTTGYKVTSLTSSTKTDTSSTLYITSQKTGNVSNAFSKVTTASDAGIYKIEDDLGDSYYFRGAPTNNYVEFGSYLENSQKVRGYYSPESEEFRTYSSLEECNNATSYNKDCKYLYEEGKPMYWRIVRINGDGSIRLVYDGTEKVANGTAHIATIATTAYNTNSDDAKYVGYTYDDGAGKQVDSTIKGALDAWYDKHLKEKYGTFIADEIFCNDRNEGSISESGLSFESRERLYLNKKPTLKCVNKEDKYTMDDTLNGNGYLSNPVGLLTADEITLAGATAYSNNMTYYLYSREGFWTSTPYFFHYSMAGAWFLSTDYSWLGVGYEDVSPGSVTNTEGVRPVINLKADVKFTGDGSYEKPYKILTD